MTGGDGGRFSVPFRFWGFVFEQCLSRQDKTGSGQLRGMKRDVCLAIASFPQASRDEAMSGVLEVAKSSVEVWRIENFEKVAWPKDLYGQFFGGDSFLGTQPVTLCVQIYIIALPRQARGKHRQTLGKRGRGSFLVLYTYVPKGRTTEEYLLYIWQVCTLQYLHARYNSTRATWQRLHYCTYILPACLPACLYMCMAKGRESSQDEKGASALLAVALDDEYGGRPVQVRSSFPFADLNSKFAFKRRSMKVKQPRQARDKSTMRFLLIGSK
eukprot:COSAG06_NODE_692_length_13043_cov_369.439509_3_plen_270_part_00